MFIVQRNKRADISLSLEVEPDVSSAETKATYNEIRDYVKEYFGFNVTNLYIAQVKRKYGLIELVNYHIGKEGHRVPQCPPEKWAAIEEALRHFQMI